ncbi:hypothetical protein C8R44DRAFT_986495 [Mycena epipterygia]|nr:hypothetical protein C8R44DRAFT_986495 [Mycena epipterygia]
MAWYHAQFTTRRFNPYTPNPVSLATLPAQDSAKKPSSTPDSLFGPNIGPVPPGPAWTTQSQPKRLVEPDELTTDTVRTWIEKSKLPTTPTTTLQAQVNLRRPTLRLSPLAPTDGVNMRDAPHLLEFQFDCQAPQCGVHVHVLLPANHPDAPAHGGALRVFEAVVAGGFARALGPADAAVIELARFERMPAPSAATATPSPESAPAASTAAAPATAATAAHERKRFTPFHFRRRGAANGTAAAPVAGAALAVVEGGDKKEEAASDDDEGVRVTIRLVALDAAGRELDSPNEQTVYLLVGRLGAAPTGATSAPAAGTSTAAEGAQDGKDGKEEEKEKEGKDADARPWVVRVVKREATIGPHTFHLHEIYGLSSAAAAPTPAPAASSTYPPQPPPDDPPERECLLCLSAPREVVLLPCRHLVACRPCALNMVEFGAGGAIVAEAEAEAVEEAVEEPSPAGAVEESPAEESPVESPPDADEAVESPAEADVATESPAEPVEADVTSPAEPAVEGAEATPATAEAPAATPAAPAAPATAAPAATPAPTPLVQAVAPAPVQTTTRRKRKAKGWFCPVCRQPYTSLLRITTAPPPAAAATGSASALSPGGVSAGNTNGNNASGNGGNAAGNGEEEATSPGGGGILGGLSGLRPAFLRGLSRRPGDVEAQV